MNLSNEMQNKEIRRNAGAVVKQRTLAQIINSVHTMMLYHLFGDYLMDKEPDKLDEITQTWSDILKRKFDNKLKADDRSGSLPTGLTKKDMADIYNRNLDQVFSNMKEMLKPVTEKE